MIGNVVAALIGLAVGGVICFFLGIRYRKTVSEKEISSAEEEGKRIINEAIKSAETKKKEALLEAKEEILTYIRNYLKNGGTVILTSHETQELSICTQLFVMKKGLLMPVTEKLSAAELVLLF